MKPSVPLLVASFVGLFYASLAAPGAPVAAVGVEPKINYDRDVMPIVSSHCYKCHGPDASKAAAGLRLDFFAGATKKLEDGAAIVPGHPESSILLARVSAKDPAMRMPPPTSGLVALTADQVAVVRAWIAEGAHYAKHWSFVPPATAPIPNVSRPDWCRNDVDRFVLAKLDAAHLKPEPEADRDTLAMRVAETLTGLAPSQAELEQFRNDRKPGAYERYVDRLLAEPSYGEQEARYWLDAVRYADTHGLQLDNERSVYPYRDWVVSAFNEDLPFDKFVLWQLAGDLLPHPTTEQLVATGYVRMNLTSNEGGAIPEEFLARNTFDRVDTTGTVLLGLTVGCAKCHDHKFDPIRQRDYYGLYAFFDSTKDAPLDGNIALPPPFIEVPTQRQTDVRRIISAKLDRLKDSADPSTALEWATSRHFAAKKNDLDRNIDAALSATRKNPNALKAKRDLCALFLTAGPPSKDALQFRELTQQKVDLDASIPRTLIAQEMDKPRPTFILKRGLYDQPSDSVVRHIPPSLGSLSPAEPPNRLGFAEWVVSPQDPLLARVFVNRLWQQCFGVGIVKTSEDFGSQGEWPVESAAARLSRGEVRQRTAGA